MIEEDLLRLKVTVENLVLVQILDSRDDLLEELACACLRKASICNNIAEQLAASVFKNDDNVTWSGDNFVPIGILRSVYGTPRVVG